MGGLPSAAAATASLVADAYMAAPADVAAAATTVAGPVSCTDLICRDIYASFALELVWTIAWTCMYYCMDLYVLFVVFDEQN